MKVIFNRLLSEPTLGNPPSPLVLASFSFFVVSALISSVLESSDLLRASSSIRRDVSIWVVISESLPEFTSVIVSLEVVKPILRCFSHVLEKGA